MLKSVVLKLDVTGLDEEFLDMTDFKKRIRGINMEYFNQGEGDEWEESVPFEIVEISEMRD